MTCKRCGEQFDPPLVSKNSNPQKSRRQTCTRKCQYEAMVLGSGKKLKPKPNKHRDRMKLRHYANRGQSHVHRVCIVCGYDFLVPIVKSSKGRLRYSFRKTCSKSCVTDLQSEFMWKRRNGRGT